MHKDVRNLLSRVQRAGAQVVNERGELKVYNEGRLVTTLQKNPGPGRWRDRALRELESGGVILGHARRRRGHPRGRTRGAAQGPLAAAPYVPQALPLLPLPGTGPRGARAASGARTAVVDAGQPSARLLRYYAEQLLKLADEIEAQEKLLGEIRGVFNGSL